jgi:hypothetical protein
MELLGTEDPGSQQEHEADPHRGGSISLRPFSVALGRSPESGRIRPYKIGGPADVEEAWSGYYYTIPLL